MRQRWIGWVCGLTTLVVACCALALSAGAASATTEQCTCRQAGLTQQINRADGVFVGVLDGVTPSADGSEVEYAVTATRVYQGSVDSATTVTSPAGANACGLGDLDAGAEYLWFVGSAAEGRRSTLCSGTGPTDDDRVAQVEEILGAGRSVVPPAPETATRTLVDVSPPAQFTRLAAPGAAVAILGLLGLVVVGRLSKR